MRKGSKHSIETKAKMSAIKLANPTKHWLGKKFSKQVRERMSKAKTLSPTRYWLGKKRLEMSFEKNKNWKGGATRYRKLAFERYNLEKICSVCGSIENIIVHHIDENRRNNAIENFQIMCNPCHTSHHRKGFTKKRKEKIN